MRTSLRVLLQTADYSNDKKTLPPKFTFSGDKMGQNQYILPGKVKPCLERGGKGLQNLVSRNGCFQFQVKFFRSVY